MEGLKLETDDYVAPGADASVGYKPDVPFEMRSFSIDPKLAPHVEVLSIRVGRVEQMVSGPIPGEVFELHDFDYPGSFVFDLITPDNPLSMRLRNASDVPRRLGITIKGIDSAELKQKLEKFLPLHLRSGIGSFKHDAELEISPTNVVVAPGATVTSETMSQRIFRANALIINRPHLFNVLEVRVGLVSQFWVNGFDTHEARTPSGISATVLRDLARAGVPLRIETMQSGQTVTVVVKNVGDEPAPLSGRFVGVEAVFDKQDKDAG